MLQRDARTGQVGVGPTAVVLHGADADLVRLLDGLDGTRSLSQLRRCHPLAREALDLLAEHDLLVTSPARGGPDWPGAVLLLGAGTLGRAVALRLHALGIPLLLWDPDPPPPALYPGPPRPSSALALRSLLASRSLPTSAAGDGDRPAGPSASAGAGAVVVSHWSDPLHPEPALAVVARDRGEADRGLTDSLVRRDLPHLLLRPLDAGAQVGPFVVPGQGCCTRCTDLYRIGRDPAWPRVLAQLIGRRQRVRPAVADWAAAVAVPSVVAALRGGRPDLLEHTLELDLPGWGTRVHRWPPHPGCGCDLREVLQVPVTRATPVEP